MFRLGVFWTPKAVLRPIREGMLGGAFGDLTGRDAARVVEGVALLQWIRWPIFVAVFWVLVNPLTHLADSAWGFFAVLWFGLLGPAYMLVLGVASRWLQQPRRAESRVSAIPGAERLLVLAPAAALAIGAGLAGLATWAD